MKLEDDWEFNVLGLYNYRKPGKLKTYFDYIFENHDYIEGDLLEAGVFRGRTLIATGLFLKEIGSNKQVFGFESFLGLKPVQHENDNLDKFDELLKEGQIDQELYAKVKKNQEYRNFSVKTSLSGNNISLSGDFSETNAGHLRRKIDYFGLDNVHIVEGLFEKSMTRSQKHPQKIMAASLDCDYYMSYKVALPFVWERMSKGGYIWLDEYYSLKFPGARIATDEFFSTKIDKPQRHKVEPGFFERWYVKKLFGA